MQYKYTSMQFVSSKLDSLFSASDHDQRLAAACRYFIWL